MENKKCLKPPTRPSKKTVPNKKKNYTSDIQNHAQEKDFDPHPCGFPLFFSVAPSSKSSDFS
jgi:hypothetical protein